MVNFGSPIGCRSFFPTEGQNVLPRTNGPGVYDAPVDCPVTAPPGSAAALRTPRRKPADVRRGDAKVSRSWKLLAAPFHVMRRESNRPRLPNPAAKTAARPWAKRRQYPRTAAFAKITRFVVIGRGSIGPATNRPIFHGAARLREPWTRSLAKASGCENPPILPRRPTRDYFGHTGGHLFGF